MTEPLASVVAELQALALAAEASAPESDGNNPTLAELQIKSTPERIRRLCVAWMELRALCERARPLLRRSMQPAGHISPEEQLRDDICKALAGEPARGTTEER